MRTIIFALAALTIGLVGCIKEHKVTGAPGPVGTWMEKSNAEELQKTGKLESQCELLKQDPSAEIVNIRRFDANGEVHEQKPAQKGEVTKVGTFGRDGYVPDAVDELNAMGGKPASLVVKGDEMTIIAGKKGEIRKDYVRVSQAEVDQYFAAQDACRK